MKCCMFNEVSSGNIILSCDGLMNACGKSKERSRWELVRNTYDSRNI
jgi:hypothetical protein